ncbi:hypothetical protein HNQ02_002819 [Flavobacterium sp. 7E]|nr:hypothetical protein [Flavobacterium sp. 7E]
MMIPISFSNEKMRDFQSLVKQTSALSVQSGLVENYDSKIEYDKINSQN